MKAFKTLVAVAAAIVLAVSPTLAAQHKCGRGPCPASGGNDPSPVASLQQFTVADLQAALADANARTPPDTRHGKCWQALIPVAQQWQSPVHAPTAPGLAELAQTFFDAQAALNQPLVPDSVIEACSETVFDLKIDFARLAGLVGVRVVTPHFPVFPSP